MKRVIVCECVGTHTRHDTSLPLYRPVHILDDPPPFLQLHLYLMDDLFLNQKTKNNIRISYSLKYKHLKKEYILYEKKIKKPIVQCQLCTGANFAKKNPFLVARIVPYYTAGLHLLTFHISEAYPSKDIALLSHVISPQWHYYSTL